MTISMCFGGDKLKKEVLFQPQTSCEACVYRSCVCMVGGDGCYESSDGHWSISRHRVSPGSL